MGVSRRSGKHHARRGRKGGQDLARKGYILTVVDGSSAGKELFFEGGTIAIGRVEQNDVVLVDPGISRCHARVIDDQGVFLVEDLGSANGTRLNAEQVSEPEVLRDGDYITLGQVTLQFSSLNAVRGEITAKTNIHELEKLAREDQARPEEKNRQVQQLLGFVKSRRGKVVLGLVGLAVVALVVVLSLRGGGGPMVFDQSDTPLIYSDEDAFFNAVFGFGKYDRTHKNKVIIQFEYLGGRVTLRYGAWGVDKVGEVAVMLDHAKVGQVPLTMNRWIYGLKLNLPRAKLKNGQKVTVTFDNTRNPPNEDPWEVCYVQIDQQAIPPPDPREARQEFELAKKAWEDREIEPSNMSTALVGFKKARNLLEGLSHKPPLYQEMLDYIDKVDKALTREFEDGIFSARRAEKLDRDTAKARRLLLRTRRYFRRNDFRYREIQRYLDALADL